MIFGNGYSQFNTQINKNNQFVLYTNIIYKVW